MKNGQDKARMLQNICLSSHHLFSSGPRGAICLKCESKLCSLLSVVCVCVHVCYDLKRYPSVIFLTVCPHCKLLAPDFHTIISLSFPFCPYSLASLFRKRWSCPRLCYPREEVLARPRLSLLRVYHSRLTEQRPVFRPSAERFSWCNPQTGHNISFSSGCIKNTYSHFWFSGLKV